MEYHPAFLPGFVLHTCAVLTEQASAEPASLVPTQADQIHYD